MSWPSASWARRSPPRPSERMTKAQREYFLREQLRAIQQELGEEDENGELAQLRRGSRRRPAGGGAPRGRARAERLATSRPPRRSTASSAPTWTGWRACPGTRSRGGEIDVPKARQILDEDHYDLEKIKDRILEYLAVKKLRQERQARPPRGRPRTAASRRRPPNTQSETPDRPRGARADPLLRRAAGRRQDQPRAVDRAVAGAQVRADLAGRRPRRGRDPRAIAGPTSGRCPAASSSRSGGPRRETRSSCWTRSTRSARTGAAIRPRRCWRCWTRPRTTASWTTTWAWRSTSRRCCS